MATGKERQAFCRGKKRQKKQPPLPSLHRADSGGGPVLAKAEHPCGGFYGFYT